MLDRVAEEGVRPSDEWRAVSLQRFSRALLLTTSPLAAFFLSRAEAWPTEGALLVALLAVAAWVSLSRRTGYGPRGAFLILALLALGSILVRDRGPVPESVLLLALSATLASVVFGDRVGHLTLVASILCFAILGWTSRRSSAVVEAASLSAPITWVYLTALDLVLTALLVRLVSGTVSRVEASLVETREALSDSVEARLAREAAETEARGTEERLRLALKAADMGVWEWTVSNDTVHWSGTPSALLGVLGPEASSGSIETLRGLVAGPDAPEVENAFRRAMEGPLDEYYVEFRVKGLERWIESRGRVQRDAEGYPTLVRGTVVDATTRKVMDEALRAGEERWRRLSEAAFEGIVFSRDGVILDVNAQFAEMLGYSQEELIGKEVIACVAPEDRERVASAIRAGRTVNYEHRARRKDGSVFPVETRARILERQAETMRVTAIRDMSERGRFEAELRRQETLAVMGSLVAGVAHEVRTPLFSLSATLDALDAGFGTPEEREELRQLLRSQVTRLSHLMQDLLDYGRPPKIRKTSASVIDPLERAARSCEPVASRAGVTVELVLPRDLPEIPLDIDRIQQVFENLIANAAQHSPRAGTVRVTAAEVSLPQRGVLCAVEDAGPGLSPEDLNRVFEPFFSRRSGGTGLGLAIAHRFVEAHGGILRVANRPEGGAQFTAFLPSRDATETALA